MASPSSAPGSGALGRPWMAAAGAGVGVLVLAGVLSLVEATDQARRVRESHRARRAVRARGGSRVVAPKAPRWPTPPPKAERPVYRAEDEVPDYLRRDEARPLPQDFLVRLDRALEEVEGWVVTRSGLAYAPRSRPPAGALPLLHPDPMHWEPFLDAVAPVREFRAWVAGGGDPGTLPPAWTARLREIDATLAELGMARPFYPFVYLDPEGAAAMLPAGFREGGEGQEATGWLALALRAWADEERLFREKKQEAEDVLMGRRVSSRLPGRIMGIPIGIPLSLRDYVGGAFVRFRDRVAVTLWLRDAEEATRRMLYAAGRSLKEEPRTAADAGRFFGEVVRRREELWFSPLGFERPVDLLAGPPGSLAGWFLHAATVEAAFPVREVTGAEDRELYAEAAEGLRRIARAEPGDPGYDARMVTRAVLRLGELHRDQENWPALVHTYMTHLDRILEEDPRDSARVVAAAAAAWAEDRVVDPPRVDVLERTLAWMRAHPRELERVRRSDPKEDLHRLAGLLRARKAAAGVDWREARQASDEGPAAEPAAGGGPLKAGESGAPLGGASARDTVAGGPR